MNAAKSQQLDFVWKKRTQENVATTWSCCTPCSRDYEAIQLAEGFVIDALDSCKAMVGCECLFSPISVRWFGIKIEQCTSKKVTWRKVNNIFVHDEVLKNESSLILCSDTCHVLNYLHSFNTTTTPREQWAVNAWERSWTCMYLANFTPTYRVNAEEIHHDHHARFIYRTYLVCAKKRTGRKRDTHHNIIIRHGKERKYRDVSSNYTTIKGKMQEERSGPSQHENNLKNLDNSRSWVTRLQLTFHFFKTLRVYNNNRRRM